MAVIDSASEREAWAARAWSDAFSVSSPALTSFAMADPIVATPTASDPLDLTFDRFFVGLHELPPRPGLASVPDGRLVETARSEPSTQPRAIVADEEPVPDTEADLAAFNAWLNEIRDT